MIPDHWSREGNLRFPIFHHGLQTRLRLRSEEERVQVILRTRLALGDLVKSLVHQGSELIVHDLSEVDVKDFHRHECPPSREQSFSRFADVTTVDNDGDD